MLVFSLALVFLCSKTASVLCTENVSSLNLPFGYELTVSALEAVNANLQKSYLRSHEFYQVLRSDFGVLERSLTNTEKLAVNQAKALSNLETKFKKIEHSLEALDDSSGIRTDLEMLSHNVSRLLDDTSKMLQIQQTLPTIKQLNDFILQLSADRLRSREAASSLLLEPNILPQTCADVSDQRSGIQRIHPESGFKDSFQVYCDQDYEGGGWTVIQNRYDGSVNFYRGWSAYENGFGDLKGEFWLGLKKIHELTYARQHELHIVLEDFEGKTVVAKYSHLLVAGPEEKYALNSLGSFSGDAGDSLSGAVKQKFTTLDSDNDSYSDNCAIMYQGGWWYGACHESNLNGLYMKGKVEVFATMMCWKAFKGYHYGLKRSRMLIRPVT